MQEQSKCTSLYCDNPKGLGGFCSPCSRSSSSEVTKKEFQILERKVDAILDHLKIELEELSGYGIIKKKSK